MRVTTLVVSAFWLLLSLFSIVDVGFAKGGGHEKLQTNLKPCCGDPVPGVKGKLQSDVRFRHDELVMNSFKGKVDMPVPADMPDDAVPVELSLQLFSVPNQDALDAEPYAECSLEVDEIEEEEGEAAKAVYKVHVRMKLYKGEPRVRMVKGGCEVFDEEAAEFMNGVPVVHAGDVVKVGMANPDPENADDGFVPFASGTFK